MINLVLVLQFQNLLFMETKLYNFDYLKELSGGDKEFEDTMISYFISNTPNLVQTIDDLVANEDWKQIREDIHRFIPNLNVVGASLLLDDANNIEKYTETGQNLEKVPVLWTTLREQCLLVVEQLENDYNI